jgi:hypothetical protein
MRYKALSVLSMLMYSVCSEILTIYVDLREDKKRFQHICLYCSVCVYIQHIMTC